jgi:hypothetical protein
VLTNASHHEHEHMVSWAPDGFDPEVLDVETHDAAVRKAS